MPQMQHHDTQPAADAAHEMLGLLRRQATLYEQLERLARQQQSLIAAEDAQPLLRVLAQRQRLTGELQNVAERIKPLHGSWTQMKAALTDDERRSADHLLSDAKERLSRLLASDEEDARRLRIRKQQTGDALRTLHTNRQAVAAYGAGAAVAPGCLDRMHEDA